MARLVSVSRLGMNSILSPIKKNQDQVSGLRSAQKKRFGNNLWGPLRNRKLSQLSDDKVIAKLGKQIRVNRAASNVARVAVMRSPFAASCVAHSLAKSAAKLRRASSADSARIFPEVIWGIRDWLRVALKLGGET